MASWPRVTGKAGSLALLLCGGLTVASGGATARPPGAAPVPLRIALDVRDRGFINVSVAGQPGSRVNLSEGTPPAGAPLATLTLTTSRATLRHLTPWRCDVLDRRFSATGTLPDGSSQTASAAVMTPSCATRLRVTVIPTAPRVGHLAVVEVADQWRAGGISIATCITPPGAAVRCVPRSIRPGAAATSVRFRVPRIGRWRVTVIAPFERVARSIEVRRGRLVLLATGDSEIQGIDSDLASSLRGQLGARVISEAHISSSISGSFFFNWPARAPQQARADHPDITVMYLGGNEGFPLTASDGKKVPCCGSEWVHAYSEQVRGMMAAYLRGGAGRVYWFTLPTPRSDALARVLRAVNPAIFAAAATFATGVRVVDIRPLFTPGGRFRFSMTVHGRPVVVREPDGYHLSIAGNRLATSLVVHDMRQDGVID